MPHSKSRPDAERSARNPGQNDDPSPPVAARRDENLAISFRHFLQPHSDVVPTTTRHARNSRGSGSVDLVDGASMALPDFVQDHLLLESLAASSSSSGNTSSSVNHLEQQGAAANLQQQQQHAAGSSLDMSVLSAILPDFTTSQRNQSCLSKRNRKHQQENSSSSSTTTTTSSSNNGEGACSASSSHSQGPVALPDFLSDGPMLCTSNNNSGDGLHHNHNNSSASSSPNRSAVAGGGAVASSLHSSRPENSHNRDSDLTASQQIDRLRRELADKNRRLSQLESDFNTARNEASMFESAYAAANRRASLAEAQVAKLKSDLALFKDQVNAEKPSRRRDNCNSVDPNLLPGQIPTSSAQPPSHQNISNYSSIDSNRVMEIARSSEILVGQLLEQLDELKFVASESRGDTNSSNSKEKMKSSKQ